MAKPVFANTCGRFLYFTYDFFVICTYITGCFIRPLILRQVFPPVNWFFRWLLLLDVLSVFFFYFGYRFSRPSRRNVFISSKKNCTCEISMSFFLYDDWLGFYYDSIANFILNFLHDSIQQLNHYFVKTSLLYFVNIAHNGYVHKKKSRSRKIRIFDVFPIGKRHFWV